MLEFQGEAAEATLSLSILFFLRLPVVVFAPAFAGLQKVHWEQAYGGLGSIANLFSLVATILLGGDLVMLALFTGVSNLGVGIASGIHLFSTYPETRPRVGERAANAPSTRFILASGGRFFLMGISVLIISNTSNLIIGHHLGPQAVTAYGVTFKLFSMGFSVVTAANLVLWPMYARATSSGEWQWVERVYNQFCQLLAMLAGLLWVGGVAFAKEIVTLWAGPAGYAGLLVVGTLGGYGYALSLVNTHTMLLNGLNRNRNVVIVGGVEAGLNLAISLALVGVVGMGGVALGMFSAIALSSFWFLPLDVRHQTNGRVSFHPKAIAIHATCVLLPALVAAYLLDRRGPADWRGVLPKTMVLVLYLGLSWYLSPADSRDLVRRTTRTLLVRARLMKPAA